MDKFRKKRMVFRQDQLVVKSNDLIQKARYNLSLEEQRIICYLISQIRPEDTFFREQKFSIQDYCDACGILWQGGSTYEYIKTALKALRDRSFWVPVDNGFKQVVSWFSLVRVHDNDGTAAIKFDEMMVPYLLHLRERFTQYQLRNILAMRSKYSVRLYELLKSYVNLSEPIDFDLDHLRTLLDAQTYQRFPDFRLRVLEPAVHEIMEFSDLNITYNTEKSGRAISRIIFRIRQKNTIESLTVWANQDTRLFPASSKSLGSAKFNL